MPRRLLDTLLYAAEGLVGRVYYDDGQSTGSARLITVDYADNATGQPTGRQPSSSSAYDRRSYQPGQAIGPEFCEGTTGVSLTAARFFPFADITAVPNATLCTAPVVVCDLQASGTIAPGTSVLTLTVSTTHGPWSSSLDGVNFTPNRTEFQLGFGARGSITVRDAANCQVTVPYQVPDPQNPKPPGEIVDNFTYGNTPNSRIEVYILRDAPYTVAAWNPAGQPLPGILTEAQRGRPNDFQLPSRCGGVTNFTQITPYSILAPPYVRVTILDNAPGCGYTPPAPPTGNFDFKYVDGTPETVAGGDGTIQAAVVGNDGPVLFSLDNYRTPGQANPDGISTTFKRLRSGTYTVYARETRPSGRTISRTITLAEPASGVRYRTVFKDQTGSQWEVRQVLRGYAGPVEELRGTDAPLTIAWAAASASGHFFDQQLRASSATLAVIIQAFNRPADLDLSDERQMRLEVDRDGVLVWMGWELPDLYEEPLLSFPYTSSIRATDALGTLKQVPFTDVLGNLFSGEWTHWTILRHLLDRLALPLPWAVLHTLYPADAVVDAQSEPLQLVSCEVGGFVESNGKPWTCGKVLESLLAYHAMRLQQRDGVWYFERLTELSTGPMTPRRYNAQGQRIAPTPYTLLRVIYPPAGGAEQELSYVEERQLVNRHPAVAGVSVTQEPGEPRNYLAPYADFPLSAFEPASGKWRLGIGELPTRRELPADVKKPAGLRLLLSNNTKTIDFPDVLLPVAGYELLGANPGVGTPAIANPFICTLAFTATPGVDANYVGDEANQQADLRFSLGIRFEPSDPIVWLSPTPSVGLLAPGQIPVYAVNGSGAKKVSFEFVSNAAFRRQVSLVLRFYGSTAGDIIISEPKLSIGTAIAGAFVNESQGDTKAKGRLSARDEDLTLRLADTLNVDEKVFAVLQRSVLLASTGAPVSLWREGPDPQTTPYYGVDLLVRDRLGWQQRPCWVLRALLLGECSPGALLADPDFSPEIAFVVTSVTWNCAARTWDVTAVQDLFLRPPRPESTFGLLAETGALLLSESLAYTLVPEDAY